MMATVPHVTSGLRLRKFQADGFLLTRVYKTFKNFWKKRKGQELRNISNFFKNLKTLLGNELLI